MHAPTQSFFDITTNSASYVVRDPSGTSCAIIDSVLDFDYASGQTDTKAADQIIAWVKSEGLDVKWILETHAHADHLSAAPYLQERLGGKIGISEQIKVVQDTFGKVFNEGTEFERDGSQFDRLFNEGDSFHIGQLRGDVMYTPGHTPACVTYVLGCGICRRYFIHARFWHRALRLSGWFFRDAISIDPENTITAGRNPHFCVP